MFTTLDRYILRSLLINYIIALAVMMSLYVVLDLFVNMDEFTEHGFPFLTVAKNIFDYYTPNLFLYFAQLSGAMTLFACLAVLARMRKFNEMTAILSSGVSLYRIAAPIIAFGLATTVLMVIDTEWFIPAVAHKLSRDHDDIDGTRAYEVLFMRDRDDALLSAGQFHPTKKDLQRLLVIWRDEEGTAIQTLEADHATWEPPDLIRDTGRWKLQRGRLTKRVFNRNTDFGPSEGKEVSYPEYYESELSPDAIELRQSEGWVRFLNLAQLKEMEQRDTPYRDAVLRAKHERIAAPIVSIVLLLLGLPFFLDRSPVNVVNDAGRCMVACGLCYVSTFVTQSIRPETESAFYAWIPIFIFGTIAMVLLDRVRT